MIRKSIFITHSGSWPITLQVAKDYCRVTNTADNDFIEILINTIGDVAERYSNAQFAANNTVKIVAVQPSEYPSNLIELPYPNSDITIVSITKEGTALTTDEYEITAKNVLKLNEAPSVDDVVVINYTSTVATQIDAKLPMLKLIADAYENRTEQGIEGLSDIKKNAHFYFQSLVNGSDLF